MQTSLNWGKLIAQGRAKDVGIPWSNEELHAIHELKIPTEYVRDGVLTLDDYSKELDDGRIIHLVLNDTDFPTDGSAVVTYPEGSKRAKSTSFEVKSEKDIPNVLKKVERWAK